jgi:hypothetical protein
MKNFNELSYKKQCLIAEQLRALNNEEFLELANELATYEQLNILNLENLWNELHNDYDKKELIELFLRSEIENDHEFYCWKINDNDKEFIRSYSREDLNMEYLCNYTSFLILLDKATNGKIKEIIDDKNVEYVYDIYLDKLESGSLVGDNGEMSFKTKEEALKDANVLIEDLAKEYNSNPSEFRIVFYEVDK